MYEKVTFTQLALNSDYSKFSSFDCDSGINPSYAKKEIRSLSKYLSDTVEGARADLKNGYGITTVAYVDEELAGYFTIMASSIYIERLPKDFPDRMHFTCLTYPALKISRLAVDKKFQKKDLEPGKYGARPLHLSDIMLREIVDIANSLNMVGEYTYNKDDTDERPDLLGVRFIIVDALAVEKTLNLYKRWEFITFYAEPKDENDKPIKGVNKYDLRLQSVYDRTFKSGKDEDMAIPMFLDIQD